MEATPRSKIFGLATICLLVIVILAGVYYVGQVQSSGPEYVSSHVAETIVAKPKQVHIKTPEVVKAVYMTNYVAAVPDWRERIAKMIDDTELNSIVIDIKDYTGELAVTRAPDIEDYIKDLHSRNIYVIGRLSSFQDQAYVKAHPEEAVRRKDNGEVWRDRKGIAWIDAGSHNAWDYLVGIAKEYYALGFDEINFDYIRYPSDGDMSNVLYTHAGTTTRTTVMEEFYTYVDQQLRSEGIPISADLFGMTTVNKDDLGIGQKLEIALPHFDFVAPMVYPSHYPATFHGYANPNDYPGEVVGFSMQTAVKRADEMNLEKGSTTPLTTRNKLRPWLQDFDYGGDYDAADVRAQIQATYDAGLSSWMLWDAGVKYTPGALEDAPTTTRSVR